MHICDCSIESYVLGLGPEKVGMLQAKQAAVKGAMKSFRMTSTLLPFAATGMGSTTFLMTKAVGSFMKVCTNPQAANNTLLPWDENSSPFSSLTLDLLPAFHVFCVSCARHPCCCCCFCC